MCFLQQYNTCHHLDTNKLRNCAKFFAHLLCHDAIGYDVLAHFKLTVSDTTSSGRIFIKILFQDLTNFHGIVKLQRILENPSLAPKVHGMFPMVMCRS